jgi:1,4-alpha-glucan branching enzyme
VNEFCRQPSINDSSASSTLRGDPSQTAALCADVSRDPHSILGPHVVCVGRQEGVVVRSFHPDAQKCSLVMGSDVRPMDPLGHGLFAAFVPDVEAIEDYRLRFEFANGAKWERRDPYGFSPTLGDLDLHLISEGTHRQLWAGLGSHARTFNGVAGTAFAVWAPNARRVSVVGDFNAWDGRVFPMRSLGTSGVWELFLPDVGVGDLYKFELKNSDGRVHLKADPLAREMEAAPGTASRVTHTAHVWEDHEWLSKRATADVFHEALAIYEVHLGSWARIPEEQNRMLSYRELALRLVPHVKALGFTHVELLPVAEHAFYPSWGYLVTGFYAPTSRYGTPDDFRFFVDYCHQNGIGVLIDWVPAHFPKDDFALRRFDGTALYEHEDPRRGEHPDWGTLIFNLGRLEVRNFLTANVLYWLNEFHVDGLRVDAVASMLYLDFSRKEGQWLPNRYGGRENLEAVEFLQSVNALVHENVPGAFTVAEESTAWSGVTRPPAEGGLGFDFKWNMGWMHDTLDFFAQDPLNRKYAVDRLTFAMVYEYSERFINAVSHDEVVHGKRSLLGKMPGDPWQQLANLRLLLAYQCTRPGKRLLFMGAELGQWREWNYDTSLDFHLENEPHGRDLGAFVRELGRLYLGTPALWRRDGEPDGFEWIDCDDRENTVLSYIRRDGSDHVIVVLNFTPVVREDYRIGVPNAGDYAELLSSDAAEFGGSGLTRCVLIAAEPVAYHGQAQSLRLRVPPLAALVLAPWATTPTRC